MCRLDKSCNQLPESWPEKRLCDHEFEGGHRDENSVCVVSALERPRLKTKLSGRTCAVQGTYVRGVGASS